MSIKSILLRYYNEKDIKKSNKNFMLCCPFHSDKNPSLGIHEETGKWNCFGCGSSGNNIISFVSKIENISKEQAIKIVSENIEIKNLIISKLKINPYKKKIFNLEYSNLPKDFTFYKNVDDIPLYLKERLGINTIFKFKLGSSKDFLYKDRVIIPIYFKNKLITFGARKLNNIDKKYKYLYCKGFSIHNILYNYDNIDKNIDEVILMEGVFSVMSADEKGLKNVLGVFSAHEISNNQLKLLINLKFIKKVILCYDNDGIKKAGFKATIETAKKLLSFFDIYVMKLPENQDANDCDKNILLNCYNNKKKFIDIYKNNIYNF